MRAELWAGSGGFVAAFDLPPFKYHPPVVSWGSRTFVAFDGTHLPDCMVKREPGNPKAECTCGGVYAYAETVNLVLIDMHKIEAGRDKPITSAPKGIAP